MKKAIALVFGSSLVVSLIAASPAGASDPIAEKILELYPQADTDGDGVLSSAEEAALSRMALKRFPKADADGDGVLSDAEKRTLVRRAAAKARQKPGSGNPSPANVATAGTKRRKAPSFANVKYGEHERHVLDLWLADNAKPTPLAIYIHGGGFKAGKHPHTSFRM